MPISVLTKEDFQPVGFTEAARRFGEKATLTSEAFDRLSTEAKGHAFRIAGVHKVRLIQRARDIVHAAIRDGTAFREVRQRLLELFDTEGDAPPAVSRLRFVFTQNTQQAYNDARRDVLDEPEIAGAFPFRQYLTVGNGRPGVRGVRPEHAALHRLVFRWNDPFWDSHTPPWGYGCRCTIAPLTAGQVKRMGVKVRGLAYVRKGIRVGGTRRRGIQADPRFVRGRFDLSAIDKELRTALEAMMRGSKVQMFERSNVETAKHLNPAETDPFLMVCVEDSAGEGPLNTIRLAPAGEVQSLAGRFFVDEESGRLAQAALEQHGTDIPIDYEHATLGEGPAPAAGWIKRIWFEQGKGLMATVEWTQRAAKMIRAKEYRYLSPVTLIRKTDKKLVRIHSAGLTNTPAIPRMDALAASQRFLERDFDMDPNRTQANQEEGAEGAVVVADDLIGQIRLLLDQKNAGVQEGAPREDVLKAVIAFLKGESSSEGESEEAEVASSVRKALALKPDASKDEILLALSHQAEVNKQVVALQQRAGKLEQGEKDRKVEELIANGVNQNILNPKSEAQMTYARNVGKENPERLKEYLACTAPYALPGRTQAPAAPTQDSRETIIVNAAREYDDDKSLQSTATKSAFVNLRLREASRSKLANEEVQKLVA